MNKQLEENILKLSAIRKHPILLLKLDVITPLLPLQIWEILNSKKYEELDVILHTPGGSADAAYSICKALVKSTKKLNIIVPLYAKSAGTLLSLAADSIIMTDNSELGPLDTQLREDIDGNSPVYISALNGFKALEQIQAHTLETLDVTTMLILSQSGGMKLSDVIALAANFCGQTSGTLYKQLDPKKIGEYARALDIGEYYGIKILTKFKAWNRKNAEQTVRKLVKGYPSHEYILDLEELQELQLPAIQASKEEECILHDLRKLLLNLTGDLIELIENTQPETKKETTKEKNANIKV